MNAVVTTIVVAVGAFVGTMIDNFVAFAAQLSVTEHERHDRVASGHFVGIMMLIGGAATVGATLEEIPLRWVGILALAPLAFAMHAWRRRASPTSSVRRGWTTTMMLTVALGGDNLAVWIPLLRANGLAKGFVTAGVFVLLDIVLIVFAASVARHPKVMARSQAIAPHFTPLLYLSLSVVIAWECGLFSVLK